MSAAELAGQGHDGSRRRGQHPVTVHQAHPAGDGRIEVDRLRTGLGVLLVVFAVWFLARQLVG